MSKLNVLYTIEMPLTCKPWALPHSRWPRDDTHHSQRLELVTLKIALECLLKTFFWMYFWGLGCRGFLFVLTREWGFKW
jgi:hypothetical protein